MIENRELQNDIMDLYEEDIPMLMANTRAYLERKTHLFDFYFDNLKRTTDSTDN